MAPIYIIIYEIPKKVIPIVINHNAAQLNTNIKKITEIIGFLVVITKIAEKRVAKAKKLFSKFFINKY
jgi:hypothetical protein